MKRNTIRVVCNPYTNKISYYLKNELGEWNVFSGNSPLSRKYYRNTSIAERSVEILRKIDEIYNRKNKGVDILFEGTLENYNLILEVIKNSFTERDITCKLGTTKIAVVGKKSVGKTFLIDGLEDLQGFKYSKTEEKDFVKYVDECNHAEWYEINGIDSGKHNVEETFKTIERLSKEGLSLVIYCILANRIQNSDEDFIRKIVNSFVELKIMIVLTMCYDDNTQKYVAEIKKIMDPVKIVPVLAKEYKTGLKNKSGDSLIVPPFGLEDVSSFVFEGR